MEYEIREKYTYLWIVDLPFVHSIVDDWVDAAVEHGQQVEEEEHVLGVPGPHDAGVVVDDDEVGVVGQPAYGEDCGDYTKHLDNL